jgi:hypothetical protein
MLVCSPCGEQILILQIRIGRTEGEVVEARAKISPSESHKWLTVIGAVAD